MTIEFFSLLLYNIAIKKAMKNKNNVFTALAMVTQFGITVITPVLLCTFGAIWLRNKFNLGNLTVIIGILLGIASSVLSMIKLLRHMSKMTEEEDE